MPRANHNPRARIPWSQAELEWLKQHKSHPISELAGMLGRSVHSVKAQLAEIEGKKIKQPKKQQISKIGRRADCDNLFFRSSWESDFYRYLKTNKEVQLIEIEPTTFSFAPFGILKGTVAYTPDFKITYKDGTYIWIEVKGYLKRIDKTKIKRFQKYYPEEFNKLHAVPGSKTSLAGQFFTEIGIKIFAEFNDLKKRFRDVIKGWESR